MKRLIFATNNKHKLQEVRAALDGAVEVLSLAEGGLSGDIPETADTLQGNAQQKADWVWERISGMQIDGVFADDTGLEVEALGGAPGVYSARYAGEHCSFDDNIDKLLGALNGKHNRRADFRTVICLMEGSLEDDERTLLLDRSSPPSAELRAGSAEDDERTLLLDRSPDEPGMTEEEESSSPGRTKLLSSSQAATKNARPNPSKKRFIQKILLRYVVYLANFPSSLHPVFVNHI